MDRIEANQQSVPADTRPLTPLRRWWRLVDTKIGIIPLPLYPLILLVIWGFPTAANRMELLPLPRSRRASRAP